MAKEKKSITEVLKKNVFVVLFVVLAIIASATIYYTVKAMSPTAPVIVASDTIRVGEVIEKGMLTVKYLPPDVVPPTAYSTAQDLLGKTVVSGPIIYGDMIRQEHLSTVGSLKSLLHTFTPEGWHAIELPAGMGLGLQGLKKGDYVQIYGETFTEEGLMAGIIVPDAILLSVAGYDITEGNHIIAVPKEYVGVIADSLVKGTPLALALPDIVPEELFLEKAVEEIEEVEEVEETEIEETEEQEG